MVFFPIRCELEGAVEFATLQSGKPGLEQVERGFGPLRLHVNFDAQDRHLLKLNVSGIHTKWSQRKCSL
jgi:hypothetical protein